MSRLLILFRDWWRGYTNEDLVSVLRKLDRDPKPGGFIPIMLIRLTHTRPESH